MLGAMTPSPERPIDQLVLFNKPYGVLSQFTPEDGHAGLRDYIPHKGFYAAGRLDAATAEIDPAIGACHSIGLRACATRLLQNK